MPRAGEIPLLSSSLYLFSETGTKCYFGMKHMPGCVVNLRVSVSWSCQVSRDFRKRRLSLDVMCDPF